MILARIPHMHSSHAQHVPFQSAFPFALKPSKRLKNNEIHAFCMRRHTVYPGAHTWLNVKVHALQEIAFTVRGSFTHLVNMHTRYGTFKRRYMSSHARSNLHARGASESNRGPKNGNINGYKLL